MSFIESIKTLIQTNRTPDKSYETFKALHIQFSDKSINTTWENVQEIFELTANDTLTLSIYYSDDISILINNNTSRDEFLDFIKLFSGVSNLDDNIKITLNIDKKTVNQTVCIYSFDYVQKWLIEKSVSDFLSTISKLKAQGYSYLRCKCLFDDIYIASGFLRFEKMETKNPYYCETNNIIEKRNQICSSSNMSQNLVPDDFCFLTPPAEDLQLIRLIQQACTLLSIGFIADKSSLEKDHIKITISGYRLIEQVISLNSLLTNSTFYKIYRWLYYDGNIDDKIQIVRNIISLHCRYELIENLDETVYCSIKSNYKLYLQDNVKDYLALKQQVSDTLKQYCNNVSSTINEYSGYLKKNFVAALGYILTLLLTKAINLTEAPTINMNVIDISLILVGGSLIYFAISLLELNSKFRYYESIIESIKNYYSDILEDKVVEEIIDKNPIYIMAINNFTRNRRTTSIIWLVSITLITVYLLMMKCAVQ